MADDHRLVHTPTRDLGIESGRQSALHYPGISGVGGELREAARSLRARGRKKFINSRSFCTLETKLCSNSQQPLHDIYTLGGDTTTSHSDGSVESDIEIDNIDARITPTQENSLSSSSHSYLTTTFAPGTAAAPHFCHLSDSQKELQTSRLPRMGSLLQNSGLVFDKTDSLGFVASDDRQHDDDIADCADLSQICSQERNDDEIVMEENPCIDSNNVCTTSTGPGAQVKEGYWVASSEGYHCQTSMDCDNNIMSIQRGQSENVSLEHIDLIEPMSKNNDDLSVDTRELSNQQRCSGETKSELTFHRQPSKRKSDVFEAFLPESAQTDNDDDDDDDDDDDENDDFYSVGGFQSERSDPCTPTTPKTRRLENYDPYQIFEVQHTPCLILTVRVLMGRNITLGFQDYYDTPDPYINLVLRSSPEGKKTTTVKQDDPNPTWNETFTFYINFTHANLLEINLMESNSLWFDQKVGTVYYDLVNIRDMDKPQLETFVFNKVSQVDIEFKLEFDRNPTLRYSLCLSTSEKEFMEQRKEKMLKGMRNLLGDEDGPLNSDEVPTIAVIGSGGGFRAMTGYSGVFKALFESGILDCTMYAGGLSGSSWLLSTLYSHPKWPNIDMAEFLDEMKHNIDKSLLRFLNASTMYAYIKFMIQKRKDGQPVSFTDIFGRMVGETLLKGRMETTLTDQREKIKGGTVPMPLYTCVHVKKDVPARSFQEWVEFSPYEIGLPKYGTFMDSELFGSKFFMGKLVKQYKEQPLHFLQGIWGSAFCILFKRLLEDNRRIDPVEMVRQEMGKQLEEAGQESSSDCSDDEVDVDESIDSMDGDDEDIQNGGNIEISFFDRKTESFNISTPQGLEKKGNTSNLVKEDQHDNASGELSNKDDEKKGQQKNENEDDSAYEGEAEDCDDDIDDMEEVKFNSQRIKKARGSVEMKQPFRYKQSSKDSAFPENNLIPEHSQVSSRFATPGHQQNQSSQVSKNEPDPKKTVNWGACPKLGKNTDTGEIKQRRQAFVSGVSVRKSRSGSKSYWNQVLKKVFESKSWELLSTRRGRAAVIHNFMRGLSLQQSYPLSPFTPLEDRVKAGDEFDGIFEMHPTSVKHIYMVDAGLTFNSPYPLVLRPQREVDIILSFDFSARDSDNTQPFKELLLAEKWAKLNRLPFPPIDTSVFEKEGMKELYIFHHPTEPHCPVVFHFVLVNKRFKYYKEPDVPRETREEFEFAEFDIFDDPKAAYSTFNFTYAHKNFERLSQLMEFNTLLHIDDIKQVMKDIIKKKREGPPRLPIQSKDIKLLRMKSVQEMRKLRRFISKMERRSSFYANTSPSTPYFTPTPNSETNTNPFFPKSHQDISLSPSNDNTILSTTDKLSESFSRNNRFKKHLHSNNRISETEEINFLESANKDINKANLHQNSSSFESACELTPDNSNHFHHLGQNAFLPPTNSTLTLVQSKDICDGLLKEMSDVEHALNKTLESSNSVINNTTDILPDKNVNKLSVSSQQAQTSGTLNYNETQISNTSLIFGGCNNFGLENEGRRKDCTNVDESGTPGTGTFAIESSTSENLSSAASDKFISRGKQKKEPPPNPFFSKASFMRSSHSSYLSSSSSNSSLSSLTGADSGVDKLRNSAGVFYNLSPQTSLSPNSPGISNVLGRLNSRTPQLSPLVVSCNKKLTNVPTAQPPTNVPTAQPPTNVPTAQPPTNVPTVQSPTSPATPEVFSLAPEAFKTDGTPVFDNHEAKMYYEAAKSKRKFFRRQSTVSSLNNISLEENEATHCEVIHEVSEGTQHSPNKIEMTDSSTHVLNSEDSGILSDDISTTKTSNTVKLQSVMIMPDCDIFSNVRPLSQVKDVQVETHQANHEDPSSAGHETHKSIWFDADDNSI